MARRKRIGTAHPVRLFNEDIIELKRRIDENEFKTFGEAVRFSVNNYLTIKRMEKYGDMGQMREFKTAQLQILQPLINEVRELSKITSAVQAEFNDNRSLLAQLTRVVTQTETDEAAEMEDLLREVLAKLDAQHRVVTQTRENTLLMKGLLTFFTLGYQAGKIKPVGAQPEAIVFRVLEGATRNVKLKVRKQLDENPNLENDETLVRDFAQELFDKIYESNKRTEQSS